MGRTLAAGPPPLVFSLSVDSKGSCVAPKLCKNTSYQGLETYSQHKVQSEIKKPQRSHRIGEIPHPYLLGIVAKQIEGVKRFCARWRARTARTDPRAMARHRTRG